MVFKFSIFVCTYIHVALARQSFCVDIPVVPNSSCEDFSSSSFQCHFYSYISVSWSLIGHIHSFSLHKRSKITFSSFMDLLWSMEGRIFGRCCMVMTNVRPLESFHSPKRVFISFFWFDYGPTFWTKKLTIKRHMDGQNDILKTSEGRPLTDVFYLRIS